MSKSLPTPWTTENPRYPTSHYDVFDKSGNLVANCGGWSQHRWYAQDEIKKANAALIVRAVNSHKGLLEAAKEALWLVRDMSLDDDSPRSLSKLAAQLREAVAAAEGGAK